jgi:hypothetical protein
MKNKTILTGYFLRPFATLLERFIFALTNRFCIVQVDRDHFIRCNLINGKAMILQIIRDHFGNPVGLSLLPVVHLPFELPKERQDSAFALSPCRQTGLYKNRRNSTYQITTAVSREK